MTIREHFDRDIEGLALSIMKLGSYVEEALRKALAALSDQDVPQAEAILAEDVRINRLQLDIEDCCVSLIAREQPVARDLREIMTTIKVASNLERVGDHVVNICEWVVYGAEGTHVDLNS